jgi:hypothetical protein
MSQNNKKIFYNILLSNWRCFNMEHKVNIKVTFILYRYLEIEILKMSKRKNNYFNRHIVIRISLI